MKGRESQTDIGHFEVSEGRISLDHARVEYFFVRTRPGPTGDPRLQLRKLPIDCDDATDKSGSIWDPGMASPPTGCCSNGGKYAGEE